MPFLVCLVFLCSSLTSFLRSALEDMNNYFHILGTYELVEVVRADAHLVLALVLIETPCEGLS